MTLVRRIDIALLRRMRTHGHPPAVERVAVALTTGGEMGALWSAIGLAGAALDRPHRRRWLVSAAIAPAAIGLNYTVKRLVRRARPRLRGLPPLARAPATYSFPSGHAASSFASASVAPRGRPGLLALAGAMALTRPYLGLHYPSDVLAGAALGSAIGLTVRR